MSRFSQITDEIFTVAEFFTPQQCAEYIRLAESTGFTEAPITTALGPELRPDVRNNTRVMIDDVSHANDLWQSASEFVPVKIRDRHAIGVNDRLRFYRYEVGQQFNWHYDGAYRRENGEQSELTFMIYLNDGFEGGQTAFRNVVIEPQEGMALFFVHQIRHKGQPVTEGCKYVLRTDVMYGDRVPDAK